MEDYKSILQLLQDKMDGCFDIVLATCANNNARTSIVNGCLINDDVYILTNEFTNKMKQISVNPNVSFAKEYMIFFGTGKNLGNPKLPSNKEISDKLREIFISFYDRHVNDEGCCILKIKLKNAEFYDGDFKYHLKFDSKTVEKISFKI
jgi:uncharacterized pyridoxamine 5'-phosphate oxidase family protein